MEAVRHLEDIVIGDPARGIKGLSERVSTQESYMGEIRDALKKILWVLVFSVAGAMLNLLFNSGKLQPIAHPAPQATNQAK